MVIFLLCNMLDAKDAAILYQLDVNARQSLGEIAKKVRLAKTVVGYRIARLQKEGIIEQFYTLIDVARLGYTTYRVYLQFQNSTAKEEQLIIDDLVKSPWTSWVVRFEGKYNCGAVCMVKESAQAQFYDFWMRFLEKYRRYIEVQTFTIYVKLFHFPSSFLTSKATRDDREKYCATFGLAKEVAIDAVDRKLLTFLARDARMPLIKLAARCGITAPTARRKLQRLKQLKVIQGFKTNINIGKLKYYQYKIDIQLQDYQKHKSIIEYVDSHPNVIYRDVSLRLADIEIEVQVRSTEELRELIEGLRARFPGAIGRFEYYQLTQIFKISYMPTEEGKFL